MRTVKLGIIAALAASACATSGDPTPAPAPEPSTAGTPEALVAAAEAFPDMVDEVQLLRTAGWDGGDFTQARIEHAEVVSVRFTLGTSALDVVYAPDPEAEAGHMVVVRPVDAASAQAFHASLDASLASDTVAPLAPAKEPGPTAPTTTASLACGTMTSGQSLYAGQKFWSCQNGYALFLTTGALVLYAPGSQETWRTHTTTGVRATMQADGNFVLYDSANHALWSTGHLSTGDHLSLQADGNLVKYTSGGKADWATNTYCESGCVGACALHSNGYSGKGGNTIACIQEGNSTGAYYYDVTRWGHIPTTCGWGLYADYWGNGIDCPTQHYSKVLQCGFPYRN